MWEMWLVVFVKEKLKPDVTKVKSCYIAKGMGKLVGNKGGVA